MKRFSNKIVLLLLTILFFVVTGHYHLYKRDLCRIKASFKKWVHMYVELGEKITSEVSTFLTVFFFFLFLFSYGQLFTTLQKRHIRCYQMLQVVVEFTVMKVLYMFE